jgi:hypothetical protein
MYRKSVFLLALIGICLTAGTAGAQLVVKINFQLDSAVVPEGYLKDCGQVFGDRGNGYSYGWSADATADDRERNAHNDQRYDTLVHCAISTTKTWEIALPAGKYDLFFVCGDPSNTNQTNSFTVEGITVTDPDGQDNFDEYTLTGVEVTDGRLTITPVTTGLNGKVCFIDITQCPATTVATRPVPEDGATDVVRDVVLAWTAPEGASKHHVYLGTDLDDVSNATLANDLGTLAGADLTAATCELASVLAYGQTYYWRIDEVNAADGTVAKGDLWSFAVEPFAYPFESVTATASSFQANMGPANTVNGSGLNADDQHSTELKDTWLSSGTQPNWIQYEFGKVVKLDSLRVWNSNQMIENILGFGAKDVTIEYSLDGAAWTELADVPEFAQATSDAAYTCNTTVDFGGVPAKYVKLTINSTWGGGAITGLSEVRFFSVPLDAREPEPADGAADIAIDTTMSWRSGREAASHTVYFGTDANAVAEGAAAAEVVADRNYSPAEMVYGATYYWRVDEVNEAMDPAVWEGPVWSFTVTKYVVVDDFESYNDSDTLLYESWVDGLTGGNSGSMAGYLNSVAGTFGERTIVHSGKQSMPVTYDNASKYSFSEVTRTFDTAQDWTANGIQSLCLYFRGVPGNTGQLYLKVNNTKVAYYGAATDIAAAAWLPWVVDLSAVGGNLNKVTKLTIGVEGSGSTGILYIDDIRLYPKAPVYVTPTQPDAANLVASYQFEGNANDSSGHGLNGAVTQGQFVSSDRTDGGNALQLKKAGYVDLGNRPALDFGTTDWTVTAWYKNLMSGTTDADKGTIFGKGGDNTGGIRYALIMSETTSGVVSLVTDDDVTKYAVDSTSVTNDDEWHFVAGQREGTALRIYIDGRLEKTVAVDAAYSLAGTSSHNAYIGAMTYEVDDTLYKFYNGLIDDVRVYNKALSDGEILGLAGRTAPMAKPF